MLDYDVPSDDEDYDPAAQRRKETESMGAPTPRADGAASSPAVFGEDLESQRGDEEDEEEESDEAGSGYDSDLAKEIEKDLNMASGKGGAGGTDDSGSDDDDGDGLFGGSSDDDDEEEEEEAVDAETLEARKRLKLLAEEMGDLDRAIAAKEVELAKAPNPIFKVRVLVLLCYASPADLPPSALQKRFEEVIKKLASEREIKRTQHAATARELDKKREDAAAAAVAEATDPPSMSAAVQPVVGGTPAADAMDQS